MVRTIGWLLVSTIVGGCLAHERPAIDDAGTDARVTVDARAPDVGHDAFARDTNEPDAPLEACSLINVFVPSGCDVQVNLSLPDPSCDTSGPQCVRLEISGRDSLDATAAYCSGAGRVGGGEPLGINRCAPGSQRTTLQVTVLEAPTGGAGVVTHQPGLCNCIGVATPLAVGDTVGLEGGTMLENAFDQFSFFGDGAHYAVEACAWANCP